MYIKNKKLAQFVIANNVKSKRINQLVQKRKFAKYNFDDDASIFNDNSSVYDDNLSVIGDSSYLFDDVSSMYDEDFSDPLYAPPKNSENKQKGQLYLDIIRQHYGIYKRGEYFWGNILQDVITNQIYLIDFGNIPLYMDVPNTNWLISATRS